MNGLFGYMYIYIYLKSFNIKKIHYMKKLILSLASAAMVLLSFHSCGDVNVDVPVDLIDTATVVLSVSPSVINYGSSPETAVIKVTAEGPWFAYFEDSSTDGADWIYITPASGDGNGEIVVSVKQATSPTEKRSINVVVRDSLTSAVNRLSWKMVKTQVVQAPVDIEPWEIVLWDTHNTYNVWAIYSVAEAGKFAEDIEDAGAAFMFNTKKAWPLDPGKNMGKSYGAEPASSDMTPVAGFMEAATSYVGYGGESDNGWEQANDPCPSGYRLPTYDEVYNTFGIDFYDVVDDRGSLQTYGIGVSVAPGEHGFSKAGYIIGLGWFIPEDVTKENLRDKGGMFIPYTGVISSKGGYLYGSDGVALATSSSRNVDDCLIFSQKNYAESGTLQYPKTYAAPVRCIRIAKL